MINSINPYGPVNPYLRATQTSDAKPAQAASPTSPTAAGRPAAETSRQTGVLSAAEQNMIDRYFPASPAMTLRLYGPIRSAQPPQAGAVGSRLDLVG